ncbi:efflux RND transporter permease subunit [Alcaligenaceae bacterium LF4-65]|uniref:Efflux RND transporter permease subunit n=1 Tax=Zwartia hollandica TaxID=324606 RepID=A0A953NC48_9BURK|nr:efflux RND transporter permease subunit [Zwartia hollandica]MBZ1350939.1 efflux RND transporter permease subunit [Zwartia hollandica]
MWIVRTALERPYTFIVMAILILLSTPLAVMRTPVDVLPEIDIPVVTVIWSYNGLSAQQMGNRIAQTHERSLTTTVSDIKTIESRSIGGLTIIKIYFQPNVNIQMAIAQVVAVSQSALRQMPPGITPPLVIKYTASSIPVIQVGMSSKTLSEKDLFDAALNILRPQLITIPGLAMPFPYGGKARAVSVDIDPEALRSKGMTSSDVINAITTQNLTLPSGTTKIDDVEFNISMNSSPVSIAGLNNIPVRTVNGATTYLREVAHVRDGFSPQINIVRQNGERGLLLTALKNGGASTLDIVSRIKTRLPTLLPLLPEGIDVTLLADQSIFVKQAISGVVHEALLAGGLTALMLLLFLGNWRTTVIVAISIPLSIFTSLIVLYLIGQTINIMTLGGLALAVGILVDDATVTIENIERHLHMGKGLYEAVMDGAGEIAIPTFVSTLCICIVFVPMFFLGGVARYLFVPLAQAVSFAMLASYVLSRTLVPTMAYLLLKNQGTPGWFTNRIHQAHVRFNEGFEHFRAGYVVLLGKLLEHRTRFIIGFLCFCILSCGIYMLLGRDLFPPVDTGQIKLHMRAPSGTRVERTAIISDEVQNVIRRVIPPAELDGILDNVGQPNSGINLSYSSSGTIGSFDADIMITLKRGHKKSSEYYMDKLLPELRKSFPGVEFFYQAADIVTQILNFGIPAAIDVQIVGNNYAANQQLAAKLVNKVAAVPGAADVHIHQRLDRPAIALTMDRTRMQAMGLTPADLAQNILLPLSGSSQTSPNFWLNPNNNINYSIQVQAPQANISSLDELLRLPVGPSNAAASNAASALNSAAGRGTQLLGNLVTASPTTEFAIFTRYNILPAINIYANVRGRDLASVAKEIQAIVDEAKPLLPRGSRIEMRGQVETMHESFKGLGVGLIGAILLVYLLIVINFQSWLDPFIVVTALIAALAGIAWMLILTATNLSVPALTGAIMTMGVGTANSVLVISFARQRLLDGLTPLAAALEAGATRLRPVLMTALAMIIGMIPMAIGLGEGSEQNAPLGRAVIGGLIFATVSTVLFVPVLFATFHGRLATRKLNKELAT